MLNLAFEKPGCSVSVDVPLQPGAFGGAFQGLPCGHSDVCHSCSEAGPGASLPLSGFGKTP